MLKLLRGLPWWAKLGIPVVFAAIAYIASLQIRVKRAEALAERAAFGRDSTEAAFDTTRLVLASWRNSARVWQRRAIQTNMKADSLDRALQHRSKARVQLAVQLDSQTAHVTAEVAKDSADDVRSATFHHDQAPYHVTAAVQLPRPPYKASADFTIRTEPLELGIRVACGVTAVDGVRPALVNVVASKWAEVSVGSATYEREVCNARDSGDRSVIRPALIGAGAGVLATILALIAL